jgi:hypothetical protein
MSNKYWSETMVAVVRNAVLEELIGDLQSVTSLPLMQGVKLEPSSVVAWLGDARVVQETSLEAQLYECMHGLYETEMGNSSSVPQPPRPPSSQLTTCIFTKRYCEETRGRPGSEGFCHCQREIL